MPETLTLKARIGEVQNYRDAEAHEERMRVPVILTNEAGETVYEHVQSFPLTATAEEIKAHAARVRDVYVEDHERHEASKEHQAHLDAAAETAAALSNLDVN